MIEVAGASKRSLAAIAAGPQQTLERIIELENALRKIEAAEWDDYTGERYWWAEAANIARKALSGSGDRTAAGPTSTSA